MIRLIINIPGDVMNAWTIIMICCTIYDLIMSKVVIICEHDLYYHVLN